MGHKHTMVLDVVKRESPNMPSPIVIRQGDNKSDIIDAIIENNGASYDLDSCQVYFCATRPDGKVLVDECEVVGVNRVAYEIPNMLAGAPGRISLAYLEIWAGNEVVATTDDILVIVRDRVDMTAAEAHSFVSEIEKLKKILHGIIADSNDEIANQQVAWEQQMQGQRAGFEAAEKERDAVIQGVRDDADAGKFDGAAAGFGKMTVTVDGSMGTPSATVTSSGPDTAKEFAIALSGIKGEPGPRGSDGNGITTSLKPGYFSLSVEPDGHLYLTHNDNDPVPPLSIKGGKLIYTID